MIINENLEAFNTLIRKINEYEETNFNEITSSRKNHVCDVNLAMYSEDGNKNFQSFISSELYRTNKGVVAFINSVYVSRIYGEDRYGAIIIENFIKEIKENYKDCYIITSRVNEKDLPYFTDNGFVITSSNKNFYNVGREL